MGCAIFSAGQVSGPRAICMAARNGFPWTQALEFTVASREATAAIRAVLLCRELAENHVPIQVMLGG